MDRSLLRYMTPRERRLYRLYTAPAPHPTPKMIRAQRAVEWRRYVREMTSAGRVSRPGVSRFVPYLMERDHGRCQIADCKFADRRIRAKGGPGRPSADHIVPWSVWRPEDGPDPDCLENLQLAHLRCNIAKGNRLAGQVLLFG